jgi:hypothetical protein
MNGFLRSPKLFQFHLLIDYMNNIYPSAQLVKHSVDCSPFFENSWLAGFIDADGGFKIRYTKESINRQTGRKTKERIALSFKIEQRQYHKDTNEPFEPLMKSIADFFTVPLHITKHNNKEYWCVELARFSRMQILIDYLSVHALYTTKRNDYHDFLKAFRLIRANKHRTDEGKKIISCLKNGMNNKRILFNWDHLH